MQWNKVKSILLVLLVAVNLFLSSNIIIRRYMEENSRAEIRQNVITVLGRRRITCGETLLTKPVARPASYETERDRSKESEFAHALLQGDATEKEYEDGSSVFKAQNDEIVWKANGSVTGRLTMDRGTFPKNETEATDYVRSLMHRGGLKCSKSLIFSKKDGNNYQTEISCEINGISVFNCALKVIFKSDETMELTGRWNFGAVYQIPAESQRLYAEEDVLLTLVKQVPQITHIEKASLTYYMTDMTGGKSQFIPAWRIVTDRGEYCVSALKKSILMEPKNA